MRRYDNHLDRRIEKAIGSVTSNNRLNLNDTLQKLTAWKKGEIYYNALRKEYSVSDEQDIKDPDIQIAIDLHKIKKAEIQSMGA